MQFLCKANKYSTYYTVKFGQDLVHSIFTFICMFLDFSLLVAFCKKCVCLDAVCQIDKPNRITLEMCEQNTKTKRGTDH